MQFSNVQDTDPKSLRSKLIVVGLQDWFAHHSYLKSVQFSENVLSAMAGEG